MQISFLSAADGTPLTKRFTLENGTLQKTSYPMVKSFNSHDYEVDTLEQFYDLTREHAALGNCLLKGRLNRQLSAESRAGSTNAVESSQWLLLDLDNITGFSSPDEFIRLVLGTEFEDVSYIVHWSSSAGLGGEDYISCHLAFFLSQAVPAQVLKSYLEHLNYTVPILRDQLELNACGTALKYKLDVTTCQNDKLIFIAHPTFEGLDDPIAERIQLVQKGNQYVNLAIPNVHPGALRDTKDGIVAELREKLGLKKKTIQYRTKGNIEYVTNPDEAAITGVRHARGFVYLNLNGGDSWAYYFPENDPEFLFSFKDPNQVYRLKDINKDFYNQFTRSIPKEEDRVAKPNSAGQVPLVFREPLQDQWWCGHYDTNTGNHEVHKIGTRDRIDDFFAGFGQEPPKRIQDWHMVFDPTTNRTIDFDRRWINKFVPCDTLLRATPNPNIEVPPLIERIIKHALNHDEGEYNKFINWLACLFQGRTKIGTGWIITGCEGTGKGLICEHIIPQLLGADYCQMLGIETMRDSFNAWQETTIFLNFNESQLDKDQIGKSIVNRVKMMVTDTTLNVRGMRQDTMKAINHINIIITSNFNNAFIVTNDDRRWHVAPRQNVKLIVTQEEVEEGIPAAIQDFADYLMAYEADYVAARTIEFTEAKEDLVQATMTAHDLFFQALDAGDLSYFAQFLSVKPDPTIAFEYNEFSSVVTTWMKHLNDPEFKVYRDDLITVYDFLQHSRNRTSPAKFSRACTHQNMPLKKVWHHETQQATKGLQISWSCDPEIVSSWTDSRPIQLVSDNT